MIHYEDIIQLDFSGDQAIRTRQALLEIQQTTEGQQLFQAIIDNPHWLGAKIEINRVDNSAFGSNYISASNSLNLDFFQMGSKAYFDARGDIQQISLQRILVHELFHAASDAYIDHAEAIASHFANEFMAKYYGEERRISYELTTTPNVQDVEANFLNQNISYDPNSGDVLSQAEYNYIGNSDESIEDILDDRFSQEVGGHEYDDDFNNYYLKVIAEGNDLAPSDMASSLLSSVIGGFGYLPDGEIRQGDDNLLGINAKVIYSFDGNDHIAITEDDCIAYAGSGDDTINGSVGSGTFHGGTGFDWLSYEGAGSGVALSLTAWDTLEGGFSGVGADYAIGNETIYAGEALGDSFTGIEGIVGTQHGDLVDLSAIGVVNGELPNILLDLGEGNDTIIAGANMAGVYGGLGHDVISYSYSQTAVSFTLSGGLDGFEEVIGSSYGDTFDAQNAGSSIVLRGEDGADTLTGGSGDDTFYGGSGDDVLAGGAGNDIYYISEGEGQDTIIDSDGNGVIRYGNGFLGGTFYYAAEGEWTQGIYESAFNLTLDGNDVIITKPEYAGSSIRIENFVAAGTEAWTNTTVGIRLARPDDFGDTSDDVINVNYSAYYSGEGEDGTLTGGAGNDLLDGYGGASKFDGLFGNDTVTYQNGGYITTTLDDNKYISIENLVGSDASDNLSGNYAANILWGGKGSDRLYGKSGNDTLYGGAGADTLDGGSGTNVLNGGSGNDLATYASHTQGITIDLGNETGTDTLISIERVIGSAYSDTIIGSLENESLSGEGGNDMLVGAFGHDTLIGGSGNDTLQGDEGNDSLDGGDGDDSIAGGSGNDYIIGGTGYNTLSGGAGNDTLLVMRYYYQTTNGSNTLLGGEGSDGLFGGNKNDLLDGGTGDDDLHGNHGNDLLEGGDGNDILWGDAGGEISTGGDDTLNGGEGNDSLYGSLGGDALDGGEGNDLLVGNGNEERSDSASNILSGGNGNDTLEAGENGDTLIGGTGNDSLYGSNETDSYYFDGEFGKDIVNDSGNGDVIYLNNAVLQGTMVEAEDGTWALDGYTATYSFGVLSIWVGNNTITLNNWQSGDYGITQPVPPNTAPEAVADSYGLDEGQTLNVAAVSGVLANDADAEDDVLSALLVSDVTYGSLTLNADGSFTYTHDGSANYTDSFSYKANDGTVDGNTVTVALSITPADKTIIGTDSSESLVGGVGHDSIYGGEGDDTLVGSLGNDTLDGGAGSDTVSYASSSTGITAVLDPSGNGTVDAGSETDTLTSIEHIIGSDYDDSLRAIGAGMTLDGGAGNDTLEGGADGDTLHGMSGFDWLSYGNNLNGVHIKVTYKDAEAGGFAGTALGVGQATGDSFTGMEAIQGSSQDDYIDLSIVSTSGLTVNTGAGDDVIVSGAGNDTLTGGAGADSFVFELLSNTTDIITDFELGVDVLDLTDESFTAIFEMSDLILSDDNGTAIIGLGNGQSIHLAGISSGNLSASDFIFKVVPGETLQGGNGADTISGGSGSDTISGGNGNDSLSGNAGDDALNGDNGKDSLYGGAGNDILHGGNGKDLLSGGDGNDHIMGGNGGDTLAGGAGSDILAGGLGNDHFVFSSLSDSTSTARDVIADFTSHDTIDLAGHGFTGIQSGAASGTVLGYAFVGGNTIIEAAGVDFSIALTGEIALTSADFMF